MELILLFKQYAEMLTDCEGFRIESDFKKETNNCFKSDKIDVTFFGDDMEKETYYFESEENAIEE